jgi:hypothetical protein
MYLFGKDTKYLLVECDKCGKVLKINRNLAIEKENGNFTSSQTINCPCGNSSDIILFDKPQNFSNTSTKYNFSQNKKTQEVSKKNKGCLPIIAVIILIVIVISVFRQTDPKMQAYICAKDAVTAQLKSPSSAHFSSYVDSNISEIDENKYMVSGTVEAENSFGAKLEQSFYVTIIIEDKGYIIESVLII